MLKTSPCHINC